MAASARQETASESRLRGAIRRNQTKPLACENNLSETAYAAPYGDVWGLRWFTPRRKIDLCGHAMLATSHVIMGILCPKLGEVRYWTANGTLTVRRCGGVYELDLPRFELVRVDVTDGMEEAVGAKPKEAWTGRDLLCVLESEGAAMDASPDMRKV